VERGEVLAGWRFEGSDIDGDLLVRWCASVALISRNNLVWALESVAVEEGRWFAKMNINLSGGDKREVPYFMTRLHCFFLNTENGFSGRTAQLLRFSDGSPGRGRKLKQGDVGLRLGRMAKQFI
jgi:hypothetical protein